MFRFEKNREKTVSKWYSAARKEMGGHFFRLPSRVAERILLLAFSIDQRRQCGRAWTLFRRLFRPLVWDGGGLALRVVPEESKRRDDDQTQEQFSSGKRSGSGSGGRL